MTDGLNRSQKPVVDGHRFDSKREMKRYLELKLWERAGVVRNIELQPQFALEVLAPNGEVVTIGHYRADFRYDLLDTFNHWMPTVEDVKGYGTPLYRWKKKHVEAQYGIRIAEV